MTSQSPPRPQKAGSNQGSKASHPSRLERDLQTDSMVRHIRTLHIELALAETYLAHPRPKKRTAVKMSKNVATPMGYLSRSMHIPNRRNPFPLSFLTAKTFPSRPQQSRDGAILRRHSKV